MNDFLLELAQNKSARTMIKALGLPIPMPKKLQRAAGPWTTEPLRSAAFILGGNGSLGARLAGFLTAAGATVEAPTEGQVRGLLFDATGLSEPAQLRELHGFFHPALARLAPQGRVLVIGRLPDKLEAGAAAAAYALDGLVRTLGKEIGKRGASANLIYVQNGAEARLEGPLRFFLSERSAYISGQPLRITKTVKGAVAQRFTEPLAGKTALVTGAARGIGAESARLLAIAGAHVICLDRPQDQALLEAVAASIGGSVLAADLTHKETPAAITEAVAKLHEGLDVVVHNAGITRDKTMAKMPGDFWDQVLAVNLEAVMDTTAALLEEPLRDGGRVICLSSVAGIAGNVGQANYAASKAGLIGYVRAMAGPLAKRGITINALAPGFIDTRMSAAIPAMIREVGRRLNAMSQAGKPQDVAEAVTFLASPDAIGITGSVLRVCGLSLIGA